MSYKPSAGESAANESFGPFRRRREAVARFLQENDLTGLTPEQARRSVETAGFTFRPLDLDGPEPHVLSLDMVADRVTATIKSGHVLKAEPH